MNLLPKEILGYLGTFLDFNSLLSLSKVNKKTNTSLESLKFKFINSLKWRITVHYAFDIDRNIEWILKSLVSIGEYNKPFNSLLKHEYIDTDYESISPEYDFSTTIVEGSLIECSLISKLIKNKRGVKTIIDLNILNIPGLNDIVEADFHCSRNLVKCSNENRHIIKYGSLQSISSRNQTKRRKTDNNLGDYDLSKYNIETYDNEDNFYF